MNNKTLKYDISICKSASTSLTGNGITGKRKKNWKQSRSSTIEDVDYYTGIEIML